MRFDDMLATVLALAADRPDRRAMRWRQTGAGHRGRGVLAVRTD